MNALQRSRRKATVCPLTKKLGYRTKRQVIRAAELARQGKQKEHNPVPIDFYLCPRCEKWHLTSHSQKAAA
jgi:hypothetical protein